MNKIELCATLSRLSYKKSDSKIFKELDRMRVNYSNFVSTEIDDLKFFMIEIDEVEYLVFRGTAHLKTWLNTNFKFKKKNIGKGMKIHRGFLKAFNKLIPLVDRERLKDKKVFVTGHSLGGALAQLSANVLHEFNLKIELIVFESPRFGNKKYIESTERYKIKRTLIKNNIDIVPCVPPKFLGYSEYGDNILYFNRNDKVLHNPIAAIKFLDKAATFSSPGNWIQVAEDHGCAYLLELIYKNRDNIDTLIEHKCI